MKAIRITQHILDYIIAALALVCIFSIGYHLYKGEWFQTMGLTASLGIYVFSLMYNDKLLGPIRRKWFPRKLPTPPGSMTLVVVDEDEELMPMIFGITLERAQEIMNHTHEEVGDGVGHDLSECLVAMSKNCKHPNELMYMSFVMGQQHEAQSNPMVHFLGSILRQK